MGLTTGGADRPWVAHQTSGGCCRRATSASDPATAEKTDQRRKPNDSMINSSAANDAIPSDANRVRGAGYHCYEQQELARGRPSAAMATALDSFSRSAGRTAALCGNDVGPKRADGCRARCASRRSIVRHVARLRLLELDFDLGDCKEIDA